MAKRKKKTVVEAPVEVVCTETTINTPLPETRTEEVIATVEAKIEPQPDPIVDKYLALAEACRRLPAAKLNPTDRWYGEEFLPQYENTVRSIRALLE